MPCKQGSTRATVGVCCMHAPGGLARACEGKVPLCVRACLVNVCCRSWTCVENARRGLARAAWGGRPCAYTSVW